MSIALFLITGLLISGSINAQQPSDVNAAKAANRAFYAALSGCGVGAMQTVWSDDPDAQNIGPRDKAFTGGSERIQKGFGNLFDNFSELKISMAEPRIKVVGSVAWGKRDRASGGERQGRHEQQRDQLGDKHFSEAGRALADGASPRLPDVSIARPETIKSKSGSVLIFSN